MGGFFGNPDVELLQRWYQAAIFYPFFRAHAHLEAKRREPWLFGEEATNRIRVCPPCARHQSALPAPPGGPPGGLSAGLRRLFVPHALGCCTTVSVSLAAMVPLLAVVR